MQITTWNAFIVSIFALLSLVTPVANAVDLNWVARIVQPNAGATLANGMPIYRSSIQNVIWVVYNNQTSNLIGVSCNIWLMHRDPNTTDGARVWVMRSNVPLLKDPSQTESNDTVTIPYTGTSENYYVSLVSLDNQTTFANSEYFPIYPYATP